MGLLSLKVIWNFGVPYILLNRLRLHSEGKTKHGNSLSLEIEIVLLFVALCLSWFSNGNTWINRPLSIFAFGGGAILVSYIHFFVVGIIGGWLVTRFFKGKRK
ncbi:MAG: hypothetical protein HC845_03840 [Akkermansiaceae bacterium]|nr:hypothetical protein [Akkermansiaceae bacterium]